MTKKIYPRYNLYYKTKQGLRRYHSRRKKSFLYRLDGLSELKTLKSLHFNVEYFKGGFNKSIDYLPDQLKEAKNVARIFTSKAEERSNCG